MLYALYVLAKNSPNFRCVFFHIWCQMNSGTARSVEDAWKMRIEC